MARTHARGAVAVVVVALAASSACRDVLGIDYAVCGDDCDASAGGAPEASAEGGADAAASDAPSDAAWAPVYRINCGGPAVGPFATDIPSCAYCGGPDDTTWYSVDAAIDMSLTDAAPMAIYQDYRWDVHDDASGLGSSFSYVFPSLTPGAAYRVVLHFADIWNDAAGQRQFNVDINGAGKLLDFDIIQQAGAPFKAIDESFDVEADAQGRIVVDFLSTNSGDAVACVSGIEIWERVVP